MVHGSPRWMMVLVAGVVATWLGCQQASPPEGKPEPAKPAVQEPAQPEAAEEKAPETAKAPEPPPPTTIPEVHLPEQLAKTTLLNVGGQLPSGELTPLEGQPQALQTLLGEKLTVVFFWKGEDLYSQLAAVDALRFLAEDVVKPYAEKGVQVVAVNVGETPEIVRQRMNEAQANYPAFRDPEGAYFAQVATERLPRIYLLDGQGKVLWLDAEYSRTTRSQLMRAIHAALGEPPATTP
jgi:thiol-disulfide isomerase/thioredoxin